MIVLRRWCPLNRGSRSGSARLGSPMPEEEIHGERTEHLGLGDLSDLRYLKDLSDLNLNTS